MLPQDREEALTCGLVGSWVLIAWLLLFPRIEHTETVLVIEKPVIQRVEVPVEHEPTWAPIECVQARYLD